MWCWRKTEKIKCTYRVPSEDVLKVAEERSIPTTIRRRKGVTGLDAFLEKTA